MFKRLSREEVINLALDVGKKALYDTARFMKGIVDRNSFIEWLLSRMRNSSASVTLKNTNGTGGPKTCNIKHDMGVNWSLYHKTIIESIFMDVLREQIQISVIDSTLTLQFTS
ncbi:MAG: hypothetical protein WBL44_04930 [Nitrososphaeraceae archaeon]